MPQAKQLLIDGQIDVLTININCTKILQSQFATTFENQNLSIHDKIEEYKRSASI